MRFVFPSDLKIIFCFKENRPIVDKVGWLIKLCFHLRCTDRDVWITSKRLGVFFVRARQARSTSVHSRIFMLIGHTLKEKEFDKTDLEKRYNCTAISTIVTFDW